MKLDLGARPDRMFEAGFDDVGVPLARLDLTGRFTAVNPAFAKLVGLDEARCCRTLWPSPHDRDDFAEHLDQLMQLTAGAIPMIPVESSYITGHGLMIQLRGRLEMVRDGSGSHLLMTLAQMPPSALERAA